MFCPHQQAALLSVEENEENGEQEADNEVDEEEEEGGEDSVGASMSLRYE